MNAMKSSTGLNHAFKELVEWDLVSSFCDDSTLHIFVFR